MRRPANGKSGGIGGFFALSLLLIAITTAPRFLLFNLQELDNPCRRFQTEPIRALREYGLTSFWIAQVSLAKGCSDEEIELAARSSRRPNGGIPERNWSERSAET